MQVSFLLSSASYLDSNSTPLLAQNYSHLLPNKNMNISHLQNCCIKTVQEIWRGKLTFLSTKNFLIEFLWLSIFSLEQNCFFIPLLLRKFEGKNSFITKIRQSNKDKSAMVQCWPTIYLPNLEVIQNTVYLRFYAPNCMHSWLGEIKWQLRNIDTPIFKRSKAHSNQCPLPYV